ncbi:ATP-binding cassette domain-containing protein [Bacillus lacus]|uniref:ATP-binding cassette domain-containing protein n=1 Tax=Metabacillus lacus TaxID=1983721 RepID=A0A7X2IZB1_9BACI|nr:dipeptide/oligopeptide/nickel ABC transporter ATP-binding protein [Metabacillus lacus]MRX72404.1 ATP-binding cassette domain-containing protein [Metabacillus lacus]
MKNNEYMMKAEHLFKTFPGGSTALSDVSLSILKGECKGVVGESGSGKSTLAKCLTFIEKADKGSIIVDGQLINPRKKASIAQARKKIQVVFQNPAASFNPKLKMLTSVMEPLDNQKNEVWPLDTSQKKPLSRRDYASYLFDLTGLPARYLDCYPHELSGGQKQRAAIARSISTKPSLIILDEPTASLDVSIQGNVLNLLKDLQETFQLSYLFISHDLAAVRFMSDSIVVMNKGRIIDSFNSEDMFSEDRHAYTKELIHVFEA